MASPGSDSSFFEKHIDTINPDAIWDLVSSVSAFDVNVDWLESFDILLHKFLQKDSELAVTDGRKMLDLLELVEKNLLSEVSDSSKVQIKNLRKLVEYRVEESGKVSEETRKLLPRKEEDPQNLDQQEVWHGPYRRIKKLGSGNMGVVYLGEEPKSGQKVALKLLHTRNLNNIEDIENEARAAMKISDDNCVKVMGIIHDRIYDPMYGEYRKVPIVVAEYVNGQSLGDLLEHKMFQDLKPKVAFSRLATLLIIEQIAMGLCACHHVGVIHRDIKPDNCIVVQDVIDRLIEAYRKNWGLNMSEIEMILMEHRAKGKAWIKISDLGSALIAEPKGDDFTFSVKKFIPGGSPAYMAPESVRDEVSGRTDIFALGMTLYQLLTGRNPREARQVAEGINALKYQSSYVYLEDLRKAEATHAVNIETDPAFDHMRAESGEYEDNKDILELLRQMTVRDRRSRIRTTACLSTIRALVNAELKEKHIEKFMKEMEAKDAQIKQLEEENKGIKKYYSVQLKNYQSKVKMAQALEENLENELGRSEDKFKKLKKEKKESEKELDRANRHLKGLKEKKERLEETVRLVRKELERVERKLSDRERALNQSEDTIEELHKALASLRGKNTEAQKLLSEKQNFARSMSEKVEKLQELVSDLGSLNYYMQVSESLSLFPNLEESVVLAMPDSLKEMLDPSSTTLKRSTEDRIKLIFHNLTGGTLVLSELDFDGEQWTQLKESPGLSEVRQIIFAGRPLSSECLDLIVDSQHLTGLKALELRECKVSVKTMKKLLASPNIQRLESLALEETELAIDAVKYLARNNDWTALKSLSLARNNLGTDGAKALSKAHCLSTIEALNLESNGLHKDDLETLLGAKELGLLKALNLNDNHIGPEGCAILAQSERLKSLQQLNLDGNQIGASGTRHIVQSEFLKELEALYLEHNELALRALKF